MYDKEEISIKELIQKLFEWLQYFKSKWLIILTVTIIGGCLGFIYSKSKTPVYTATLTFALEEKNASGTSGISSIASTFGLNLGGGEGGAFAGDNIIELMKSRLIMEKTLLSIAQIDNKSELLINRYIDFNNLQEKWVENPKIGNIRFDSINRSNFTRVQDSIIGVIQNSISKTELVISKVDKKLSIISVKVKSTDEVFAKVFCENLVENVTDFYIETKVGKSRKNIVLLENRVDSVKNELYNAMYGRANFADQNSSLIRQSAAVPKLKQEMRVQMLGTMYGELVKNLEFSKLALMREEPLIQIIDRPIMPLKYEKISVFRSILIGVTSALLLIIIYLIFSKILKQILN